MPVTQRIGKYPPPQDSNQSSEEMGKGLPKTVLTKKYKLSATREKNDRHHWLSGKRKSKTRVKLQVTPVRMAIIYKTYKCRWGCGERETLMHCC